MVKVEVDKTPLFKDVESQRQRDENCCKHLWIATMILLAGIICGIGTYPAVYGLVERDGPSPTDMMDEACYAVYSTFFKVSLFYVKFSGAKYVEIGDFQICILNCIFGFFRTAIQNWDLRRWCRSQKPSLKPSFLW